MKLRALVQLGDFRQFIHWFRQLLESRRGSMEHIWKKEHAHVRTARGRKDRMLS